MSIPGTGGLRLNKLPAIAGVALVALFIGAFFHAASQRADRRVADAEPESVYDHETGGSDVTDFVDGQRDGLVGVNRNDIGEPVAAPGRQSDLDDRLAEWMEDREIRKLQRDTEMRERMASAQLESYERALAASSRVDGFERRERRAEPDVIVPAAARGPRGEAPDIGRLAGLLGAGTSPAGPGAFDRSGAPAAVGAPGADALSSVLATPEGQALLATPQGQSLAARFGIGGGTGSAPYAGTAPPTGGDPSSGGGARERSLVGRTALESAFVLDAALEPPRSPYEIRTGTVIPAAMISAAGSELPGDILAQVTQTVYDTATGRFVLIPQGTKLFGSYDAYTALGQERLLIVWHRLVFPDGETLDLGGMQGYDERGLAGVRDRVRTHFLRTLGNALLLSLVSASGDALVAAVDDTSRGPVFTLNLARDFAETSGAAFDEYLGNRLRIRPTLEIRAGHRFQVIVSRDIDFPGPYERGFDAYRASR